MVPALEGTTEVSLLLYGVSMDPRISLMSLGPTMINITVLMISPHL